MIPADVRMLRDETAMQRAVSAIPLLADGRAHLRTLAFQRLWVKPNRHCHAAYRVSLDTDGGTVDTVVSAALVDDAGRGATSLRELRALPRGGAPWPASAAAALIESPRALVQLFPWDPRLPTLARALDPSGLGAALGVSIRTAIPVGYWPGMRCQVRFETSDGVLFGKVFPDATGGDVARLLESLAQAAIGAAEYAVPAVRGWLASLHLLVTAPLEGTPLIESLAREPVAVGAPAVAAALARLHATRLPSIDRRFTSADDLGVVQGWVGFTGDVFPKLRVDLAHARARIETARPRDERAPVLVHRDFYDKQVLVGASRIGLLDLDTLCHGDAEIDVANFCAHLVLRGLQWHDDAERFARVAAAFVEAYRRIRPDVDPHRLRWYRASALLRLACLYALRPRWAALGPRLIGESTRALG